MSAVPLPGPAVRVVSRALRRVAAGDRGALGLVLGVQAVLSMQLRNTAFQDEALYSYVGRQELDHALHGLRTFDTYSYLSGWRWVYPAIAGLLDSVGGLALVRLFSLGCMVAATVAGAAVARHLFGRETAVPAAIVFALAGPVLFLGHLATFDALCLALMGASAAIVSAPSRRRLVRTAAAGGLLAIAFFAKYIALLFAPSIVVLAVLCVEGRGWKPLARLTSLLGFAIGAGVIAALVTYLSHGDFIPSLIKTTLQRKTLAVGMGATPRPYLLGQTMVWMGPTLVVGAVGLVLALRSRRLVTLLLFGTALLPVAYHVKEAALVSLHKHVAFGIFFLAPLGGVVGARLLKAGRRGGFVQPTFVAAVLGALVLGGLAQHTAKDLFNQWPSTSRMIDLLRSQARPLDGRFLVEEQEVPRYYLRGRIAEWQWYGTFWFEYKRKDGQPLFGTDAYRAALRDRYFGLVVLRYGPTAGLDWQLTPELRNPQQYRLIAKVRGGPGQPMWLIWRRTGPPRGVAAGGHAVIT